MGVLGHRWVYLNSEHRWSGLGHRWVYLGHRWGNSDTGESTKTQVGVPTVGHRWVYSDTGGCTWIQVRWTWTQLGLLGHRWVD